MTLVRNPALPSILTATDQYMALYIPWVGCWLRDPLQGFRCNGLRMITPKVPGAGILWF